MKPVQNEPIGNYMFWGKGLWRGWKMDEVNDDHHVSIHPAQCVINTLSRNRRHQLKLGNEERSDIWSKDNGEPREVEWTQ